jgi:PAS domain S-box-containing protein
MALSDAEGLVIAVNPAYCVLYGLPHEQLVGQPFWVIFPPERRNWAAEQYQTVFTSAALPTNTFEAEVQRPNGERRTVESRVSFLTENDRRVAMLSIVRDVTEQRQVAATAARLAEERAELYQQATETLRMRDEFISMASHELKNPLTALRGFAELLKRRGTYLPNLVDGIMLQTTRLDRLIRTMLDFSLAESGHLQLQRRPVDLVALVQQAVHETQLLTRQHVLRLEAPASPVIGAWDGDRLDQVVQNLLSNAVKYSPNGGEILVRVEALSGAARIAVTDQGVGIAPEAIPQLFTRFYRSQEAAASGIGGLGLGLAIAHMLVAAHGGQITVASHPGAGSTFAVVLPTSPEGAAAPEEPAVPAADAWTD